MIHEEKTLPKWARNKLDRLRFEVLLLQNENKRIKQAHAVLEGKDWFPINGHKFDPEIKIFHLWVLDQDQPFPICALAPNDVLIVGRAKT